MLDLVGNPNCWFCQAQAQIIAYTEFASRQFLKRRMPREVTNMLGKYNCQSRKLIMLKMLIGNYYSLKILLIANSLKNEWFHSSS